MPRLEALSDIYHFGQSKTYHAGEQFDADAQETLVLTKLLKTCREVEPYETKVLKAEEEAPADKPAPAKPRTYKRRDMRAEE